MVLVINNPQSLIWNQTKKPVINGTVWKLVVIVHVRYFRFINRYTRIHDIKYFVSKSKVVGDLNRRWHEGSLFNSFFHLFTEVNGKGAEEPSPSYYLPIAGGRIIGFIPFPRVLVLCEMQSVSFRLWTRVAVSMSYDDNHYTTGMLAIIPRVFHPVIFVIYEKRFYYCFKMVFLLNISDNLI